VGGNTVIVDLHGGQKGRYLNLLSLFHGLGSLAAPFYAGQMLAAGFAWRQVYQFSLILVVILPLYFLFLKYPRNDVAGADQMNWRGVGKTAFTREMIWFYLLIALYVAAEVGLASWLVEFLQKAKSQSVVLSSTFLSLFFGGVMLGRFWEVRGRAYRLPEEPAACFRAAILCLAIGTFGPSFAVFFLPLAGLFYSIISRRQRPAVSTCTRKTSAQSWGCSLPSPGWAG